MSSTVRRTALQSYAHIPPTTGWRWSTFSLGWRWQLLTVNRSSLLITNSLGPFTCTVPQSTTKKSTRRWHASKLNLAASGPTASPRSLHARMHGRSYPMSAVGRSVGRVRQGMARWGWDALEAAGECGRSTKHYRHRFLATLSSYRSDWEAGRLQREWDGSIRKQVGLTSVEEPMKTRQDTVGESFS